jgi:hypothetical protein
LASPTSFFTFGVQIVHAPQVHPRITSMNIASRSAVAFMKRFMNAPLAICSFMRLMVSSSRATPFSIGEMYLSSTDSLRGGDALGDPLFEDR